MTIEEFYQEACRKQPGDLLNNPVGFKTSGADMTAHLPLLRLIASQCQQATEFGLREGYSTAALISGLPNGGELTSYDIVSHPAVDKLIDIPSGKYDFTWRFIRQDTIAPGFVIGSTDFLFIDDLHTYNQVKTELERHGHKVRKYLGFHDTFSQGEHSLDIPGQVGILPAIREYTAEGWKLIYEAKFNHGVQIYERCASNWQ